MAQSPLPQNSALPLPAQARGPATLTPDRTLLRTGPPRRLTPRKQCQRQGWPPVSRRHLGPLCSRSLSRCFSGQTGPTFHGQLCFSHQREKSWRTVVRDLFSLAPTFPGWLRGQAGSGPPGHLAGLQHVPGTPMRAPCPGGSDFPALLFSEAAQTAGLCQKEPGAGPAGKSPLTVTRHLQWTLPGPGQNAAAVSGVAGGHGHSGEQTQNPRLVHNRPPPKKNPSKSTSYPLF